MAKTMQANSRRHAKMVRRNARVIVKLDKLMQKNRRRSEGMAGMVEDLGLEKRTLLRTLTRERDLLLGTQAKIHDAAAVVHAKISDHLVGDVSGEDPALNAASKYLAEAGGGLVSKIEDIKLLQQRVVEVSDKLEKLNRIQEKVRVQSEKMPAMKEKVIELQDKMTDFLETLEADMSAAIEGMVSEKDCESDDGDGESEGEDGELEGLWGSDDIDPPEEHAVNDSGTGRWFVATPIGDSEASASGL